MTEKRLTICKASAGSGKTFTLAARFIALVLNNNDFRSILAVTFTIKATEEMKERIIQNLYGIAHNEAKTNSMFDKVKELLGDKRPDDNTLRKRADEVLRNILLDYDHLSICTIDSFLQRLLAGLASKLQLGLGYKVNLNNDEIISKAIDQLLSTHLQNNDEMRSYLMRYVKNQMAINEDWDIRKSLKQLAKELYSEAVQTNQEVIKDAIKDKEKIFTYKKNVRLDFKKGEDAYDKVAELYKILKSENVSNIISNGTVVKSAKSFVKNVSKALHEGLKASDFPKMSPSFFKYLDEGKCNSDTWAKAAMETLHIFEGLYIPFLNGKTCTDNLLNMGLLVNIMKRIDELMAEQNSIPLSKTAITLKNSLQTGDADFILEKSGTTFKHIMIDEFQDTSNLQWHTFLQLIEEVLSSGGTTLLVGDIKQSIYRWRNSDWHILQGIDDVTENSLGHHFKEGNAAFDPLVRNFRSDPEIVQFNLSTFSKIIKLGYPSKEIAESIYGEGFDGTNLKKYYNDSCHDGGHVCLHFRKYNRNDAKDDNLEMAKEMFEAIVKFIDKGYNQEDVTILIRNNNDADNIIEELAILKEEDWDTYGNLELASTDSFLLKGSTTVKTIINCLRFLHNNKNTVAKLYVTLNNPNGKAAIDCLNEHRSEILNYPLYEMVEKVIGIVRYASEGEDCVNEFSDDAYVFSFLDGVIKYLDDHSSNLEEFLEYWEEKMKDKAIGSSKGKGISIMTIHKAKGLQNKMVCIPFCDWKITKDSGTLWCKPQKAPYDQMPILPVEKNTHLTDSIFNEDYQTEVFNDKIDNLNLLYVALTRAENELYISGLTYCVTTKNNKTYLLDLDNCNNVSDILLYAWGLEQKMFQMTNNGETTRIDMEIGSTKEAIGVTRSNEPQVINLLNQDEEKEKDCNAVKVKFSSYDGRISFRQSNKSQQFLQTNEVDEKQEGYRQRGTLLHAIYESINQSSDTPLVVEQMRKDGTIASAQEENEILATINKGWQNEQMADWFDGSWELFQECTIIYHDAEGRLRQPRPDRVMRKNGQTVVLDFKFGTPHEEHQRQVKEYMRLIRQMGEQNVSGYLWYGNTQQVVKVNE